VEAIQRLQALDFALVIVWALVIAVGVRAGIINALVLVLALYVGAIAASQAYKFIGGLISMTTIGSRDEMHVVAYGVLFFSVAIALVLSVRLFYPHTLLANYRRQDAVLGGVFAGIAGLLLLIGIVTILRFYVVTFWPSQQFTQLTVEGQLQRSQVAIVLRGPLTPLWWAMQFWFPDPLKPQPTAS
jgi:hypothetical protein